MTTVHVSISFFDESIYGICDLNYQNFRKFRNFKIFELFFLKNIFDPDFFVTSKSKTDTRETSMSISEFGGRFECENKMGEHVVRLGVGDDGDGTLDLRDKHGYEK